MTGQSLGLGNPLAPPNPTFSPFAFAPYGGVNVSPFAVPQLAGALSTIVPNPYAVQPLQQIIQQLQIVPQQLQHLWQLQYLQQHHLQQLQQILQLIPAQLQQLMQVVPSHAQQLPQPLTATGLPVFSPWGISPQFAGTQPGYVM